MLKHEINLLGLICSVFVFRTVFKIILACLACRWDAWEGLKGLDADKARARFVKTFYEFLPQDLYQDTRAQQR